MPGAWSRTCRLQLAPTSRCWVVASVDGVAPLSPRWRRLPCTGYATCSAGRPPRAARPRPRRRPRRLGHRGRRRAAGRARRGRRPQPGRRHVPWVRGVPRPAAARRRRRQRPGRRRLERLPDMLEAVKTAALLQKVHHLDPAVINAGDVLEMAAIGGERAGPRRPDRQPGGGQARRRGAVRRQRRGRRHPRPRRQLVYGASPRAVRDVWAAGRRLLADHQLVTSTKPSRALAPAPSPLASRPTPSWLPVACPACGPKRAGWPCAPVSPAGSRSARRRPAAARRGARGSPPRCGWRRRACRGCWRRARSRSSRR